MTKLTDEVQKPYRYFGGEYNTPEININAKTRFCMCVPDAYEVGMSNLGLRILYYLFNSLKDVSCERCFAPFPDYANYLSSAHELLKSLESGTPLKDFDFVGFSMQYELCYSNFFYMMALAGIPAEWEQRGEEFPIIAAGGPCTVNPEPMYKFFDFFFVGEGETPWPKILSDYNKMKGVSKSEFLKYIDDTYDCIYVPSLNGAVYQGETVTKLPDKKVVRNVEPDMNTVFTPYKQLVPNMEIVHDRAVAELFRGCANGCRFCQAGFIYRPVRERSSENAFELCAKLIENTGYDELSLSSLSTGDYSELMPLLSKLLPYAADKKVQLNLPSLRLDSFKGEMASGNRKSSLTFAPEAGTQRLRDVINKNITEDNIFSSLQSAFTQGFSSVKLYFMIGLPTETQEDIEGIVSLACRIKAMYRTCRNSNKDLRLSVSCSTFIPKPFTPFMWSAFAGKQDVLQKQRFLRDSLKSRGISFSYGDYETSMLEAVLARGGRSVADSLFLAADKGAKFDAWSEYFDYSKYEQAFDECGVDVSKIIAAKNIGDTLNWDFIDIGVDKSYFVTEWQKAMACRTTLSCNARCNGCGLKKHGFCKTAEGNRKLLI